MLNRSEIINKLRGFDVFFNSDINAFNIQNRFYVIRLYKYSTSLLIIDLLQGGRVIYLNNTLRDNPNAKDAFSLLVEAYNLADYNEPREYMNGALDLLKGQVQDAYVLARDPRDSLANEIDTKKVKLYFNDKGQLTLIMRGLNGKIFYNPNSLFDNTEVFIAYSGLAFFSTEIKNLTKQEVSR